MSTFVLLQCVKMVQSCVVQSCVQCRVCRVIIQHIVRRQSYGMLRLKFVNIDYVGCFFFIAMCPVILQVQGVQCSVGYVGQSVGQCRVGQSVVQGRVLQGSVLQSAVQGVQCRVGLCSVGCAVQCRVQGRVNTTYTWGQKYTYLKQISML